MKSHSIVPALAAFIVLITATPAVLASEAYKQAVLADTPLAYWRLGDDGPAAADATGAGHDGTADAGVVFGVPGLLPNSGGDTAVHTVGANRILTPGFEKYPAGSTGYTVEFWLKVNSSAGGHNNIVGDGQPGLDFFLMNYLSNNPAPNPGIIRAHLHTTAGCCGITDTAPGSIVAGETYHIVSTWEQSTGDGKVYISNASDDLVTLSVSGIFQAGGTPMNTDNPVFIGKDDREAGGDFVIDEAAIYNFPLNEDRIQAHFDASKDPAITSIGLSSTEFYATQTSPVGTLTTSDGTGTSHTYALVPGDGDTDNDKFAIDADTLVLTGYDYSQHPGGTDFSVRIRTTDDDNAARTLEQVLSITLLESLPPTAIELGNTSLSALSQPGRVLGGLSTTDGNPSDVHSYALVAGDGDADNGLFSIDESTIVLAQAIPAGRSSLLLRVRSTDIAGLTFEQEFVIGVRQVAGPTRDSLAVLSDDPLAYWRLGDVGDDGTVLDSTGNAHDGAADPGVVFEVPGLLPFNGGDTAVNTIGVDRITVPAFDKYPAGSTGYTVEYWLHVNSTNHIHHNIVGDGTGPFFLMNYLSNNTAPGGGQIRSHIFSSAGCCAGPDSTPIEAGTTYYVVSTWHQESGDFNVWITPATATDVVLDTNAIAQAGGTPSNTGLPVFIGKDDREPGGDFIIDEAAIYNYPLTPEQIQAHFDGANDPGGPFVITGIARTPGGEVTINFTSNAGFDYVVETSTDLNVWLELDDGLPGEADSTDYTDTVFAPAGGGRPTVYYRVRRP